MDAQPERAAPSPSAAGEQPATRLELAGQLARERERALAEARQLERFRGLLGQRQPWATAALMLLIALVFGLEALWGGVDLPPLLLAMGSLVPELGWAGEWWRFFACAFLHGGLLHVGMNLLVLWMLGRSLERAIGATRFLVVYFCAALAGALASSLVVEGQSVGASGAIWGLLAAEAAMAFYPQPLLPEVLLPVARRTALVNLSVNVLASFVPRVDVAAHVGGGIAGALVLLVLARWRQLPMQSPVPRPAHVVLRVLAAVCPLAFAAGLATAWGEGRPWRLAAPPELERASWAGFPWSVELPRGYERGVAEDAPASLALGDLRHDPSSVQIQWASPAPGSAIVELGAELDALSNELRSLEGLEVIAPARLRHDRGVPERPYISVRYRFQQNPEFVEDWAIGERDGVRVRVHVSSWAALERAAEGLAARILFSLGPLDARPARELP
jgi:membrane associated rhomboid family serine protease